MNSEGTGPGRTPAVRVRIDSFKEHRRNTLIGFADITLIDLGMSIRGCTIHERDGKRWCGMPAREYTTDEGRRWTPIIDFEQPDDRWAVYNGILEAIDDYRRMDGPDKRLQVVGADHDRGGDQGGDQW